MLEPTDLNNVLNHNSWSHKLLFQKLNSLYLVVLLFLFLLYVESTVESHWFTIGVVGLTAIS